MQPTDNFLFRMELFPPPKAEAVAFLDGVGPEPERFARAIVYRGADSPRHIMEYKVKPGVPNLGVWQGWPWLQCSSTRSIAALFSALALLI